MNLKLFVDCKNRKLVTSKTNDSEVTLEGLFREDTVNLQIFPVQATGVLTAPLEEVDITNITLKAGVGERDGTLQAFNDVWTKDLTDMSYTGSLNVNTTEINAELLATSAEVIEKWFELEFTEGTSITTVLQIKINITKDVIRASNVAVNDVEPPSEFVNTLNAILQSGLSVTKTTAANTVTHHIKGLENITQLEANKIARVKSDGSAFELVDETAVSGIPTLIEDLTNVDTAGVADGKVLKYDDATSTWLVGDDIDTDTGATNLNELTDVDTTGEASGKILKHDGTSWVIADDDDTDTGATNLNELTDVDTTGEASGKILKHDGTSWVIADDDDSGGGGGSSTLDALTDTDVGTKSDGQQLTWVNAESKWKALDATATHSHTLDSLSDVDTTGAADGKIIKHDGTSWVIADDDDTGGGGGSTTLDALTDTDVGTKSDGQQLTWVDAESKWKALDATATHSHTLDSLSDVDTTGAASGKVIKHDGTSWVIADDTDTGATTLNELTDVDTTGEATDKIIKHDGTSWVVADESGGAATHATLPNQGSSSDGNYLIAIDGDDLQSILDLSHSNGAIIELTGTQAAGNMVTVRITCNHDVLKCGLAFPMGWKWISPIPTAISMGDTALLSLTAFGTDTTDVVAAYSQANIAEDTIITNSQEIYI